MKVLIAGCGLFSFLFSTSANEVGPENGTLFIVGGWIKSERIYKKFIELAGGKNSSIIVIPTARGHNRYDLKETTSFLTKLGAWNVKMLHTDDPKVADTEAFCKPLENAKAIWFTGGRQWRLVDSYKGTLAEKRFHELLARGGVIAGSSAGASIQGSYLARGDTLNNQIMMGDHDRGFAFLKNTAIDQHVLARNRHFDMFTILEKRPELLGLALDEDTGIIVKGDKFTVFGSSYALVYDGGFWSSEGDTLKKLPEPKNRFYFLGEGKTYDMGERKVVEDERR